MLNGIISDLKPTGTSIVIDSLQDSSEDSMWSRSSSDKVIIRMLVNWGHLTYIE